MGARVHFPLSVPGSPLTWIRAGPVHVTTVSLGLCVCQSWLQGTVSWMPPSLLVLLLFLPPLPHSFSRPEGRGFPLKTEHSFLYASPSCWSPYWFPFTARRSFSGDGWVRHWPMGIEECHWESFSCYVIRTGPMSSHVGILSTWENTSRKQNKSLVTRFLQNIKSSWSVYLCFPTPPGVSERRRLFQMAHYYPLSVIRARLPFVCVCGKLRVCHAWLVFGI